MPLTLVVERPDGVEYRRVAVPDQGLGGRSLSVPINPAASTGTWRVRAYTDPKRPPIGEASFLVEDYVADRWNSISPRRPDSIVQGRARRAHGRRPLSLRRAGVRARPRRRSGDRRPPRSGPALPAIGSASRDEEVDDRAAKPLEDLPETDEKGQAALHRQSSTRCRSRPGRWKRR